MMEVVAPKPALSVENIAKSYGGPNVLEDVSLGVAPGEILGIIGPNGSGKTTLFGVMSGVHAPSSGRVCMEGVDVTRQSASERAKAGVGRTFQVPHTFSDMSVFENVLVAAEFGGGLKGEEATKLARDTLARFDFASRPNAIAGDLQLLDRKRLELARAVATRPKVLLLDEIAGGLTDDEALGVVATVKSLAASGVSVIWIEHLVHILTDAADRIAVLGEGRIIATGEPHATMRLPKVRELYFGMEPDLDDLDQ